MTTQTANAAHGANVDGLTQVLADTFGLYAKTHGYHWNVTGPNFAALHGLFEDQYNEQWSSLDDLAERLRALGRPAPHLTQVAPLSQIDTGDLKTEATAMVEDLLAGQKIVIASLKSALATPEVEADPSTQSLLSDRLSAHEKQAWMLRATLGVR